MVKKIYNISGFDCPNCAAKTEAHLNKNKHINYCHLDYAANKMYLTFENKELSVEEIKKIIAQVESDPIKLSELGKSGKAKQKIIDGRIIDTFIRIFIGLVIIGICTFALAKEGDNYSWLRFGLYGLGMVILLYDIVWKVILHIIHRENVLDHNLLITISCIGAYSLGLIGILNHEEAIHKLWGVTIAHEDAMEAVMVVLLFQVGHIIENIATNKSKAAIMSAVELRVDSANRVTPNGIEVVEPESLNIGETIVIKVGERIPVDADVIEGSALIDTSSLNGEYVPIKAEAGQTIYAGCMIKSGVLTAKVKRKYEDSTVAKIIDLISQGGEKKSKADEFIAKFARFYTPIVVLVSVLAFVIGGLITQDEWLKYLSVGLKILVTGCPCAIVISVPLAYFSGIGLASKNGIVIKGSNYLDELARMGKLVTDKTGTLTHGSFKITKVHPVGVKEEELLHNLLAVESLSTHPIAKAICHDQDVKKLASQQSNYQEIAGQGVTSVYKKKHLAAGSSAFMQKLGLKPLEVTDAGTVIHCAVDDKYIGYVVLSDEIKEDAQPMVNLLHHNGTEIVLLTGDKEENAKDICNKLGIDRWKSELMPEDKVKILEDEIEGYDKAVAFVGDGINDAPSIIRSDIGIAMGGIGSDVAVENADIVIMNDDPAKIYDAIKISKMARNTSIFNVIFALTIKILVAVLIMIFDDHIGMTVAVLADTGLTVLLIINSLLLLYRKVKRPKLKM